MDATEHFERDPDDVVEKLNLHALEVRYTEDPAPLATWDFWDYFNRSAENWARYLRALGLL